VRITCFKSEFSTHCVERTLQMTTSRHSVSRRGRQGCCFREAVRCSSATLGRDVHREAAALHLVAVETRDRWSRILAIRHRDEAEASARTRLAIDHDHQVGDGSEALELSVQLFLSHLVGDATDEEFRRNGRGDVRGARALLDRGHRLFDAGQTPLKVSGIDDLDVARPLIASLHAPLVFFALLARLFHLSLTLVRLILIHSETLCHSNPVRGNSLGEFRQSSIHLAVNSLGEFRQSSIHLAVNSLGEFRQSSIHLAVNLLGEFVRDGVGLAPKAGCPESA